MDDDSRRSVPNSLSDEGDDPGGNQHERDGPPLERMEEGPQHAVNGPGVSPVLSLLPREDVSPPPQLLTHDVHEQDERSQGQVRHRTRWKYVWRRKFQDVIDLARENCSH